MYLALASLKKRGRVGIPSLREIEREIEMLYGPQISQKTISRVLRRLEEKGHIRRRLEVLACTVLGAWYLVVGTWYLVVGIQWKCRIRDTNYQLPNTKYRILIKDGKG